MRSAREARASPVALLLGVFAGWLAAFNTRAAVGVIGAAAIAILVFVGSEILLLGVVAVEPWASALAFPTSSVTIPKIIGVLAVTSWILAAATGRAPLRYTPQIGWGFAFLLVVVLSLMLSPDPQMGVAKVVSYALYVTFLALFVQNIPGRSKVERCLGIYAGSATLAAIAGLSRFVTGAAPLASGPIADPNDFALFLSGAIPMAVFFAFNAQRRRWLWWVAVAAIVAGTLATLSRGALVGFGALALWAVATRRVSLPGVLAGVIALATVLAFAFLLFQPLIQERLVEKSMVADANVASREVFWSAAWRMSLDNPVIGVGPGRFGVVSQQYVRNDPIVLNSPAVHNSYLEILAEDGPFALALFLCLLGSTWRSLRFVRREAIASGDLIGSRLADALMASFVWTVVTISFVSEQLSIPIWLIAGLAGSLALSIREAKGPPARSAPSSWPAAWRPPYADR